MKNSAIVGSVAALLIAASPAFADTMSVVPLSAPSNQLGAVNITTDFPAWFYLFDSNGNNFSGNAITEGAGTFSFPFGAVPQDTYTIVAIHTGYGNGMQDYNCGAGLNLFDCQYWTGGTDQDVSFTADPPSTSTAIMFPTALSGDLTANIGAQVGDQGTLLMIGVAAGVPLVFYVIEQLVGLVPRKRR